jgi:hypothetical protein
MPDLSVPLSRLKELRSRKRCPNTKISAQDLWLSIKLQSIRFLCIKIHGIKLHGIKLQGIRPHGARLPCISDLSKDLFLPIRMANPKLTNQGTS